MRADQIGSSGAFGAVPLFTGTLLISCIALIVAVPIGLLSAIYLAEYASLKFRSVAKPLVGNPGRHPDCGIRFFRRVDRRSVPA